MQNSPLSTLIHSPLGHLPVSSVPESIFIWVKVKVKVLLEIFLARLSSHPTSWLYYPGQRYKSLQKMQQI